MDFTHPSLFGKDHWSLLAYVETCCVDGQDGIGTLDRRRLRCNENNHPLLKGAYSPTGWQPSYSTRLAGFFDFADRSDTPKAVAAGLEFSAMMTGTALMTCERPATWTSCPLQTAACG